MGGRILRTVRGEGAGNQEGFHAKRQELDAARSHSWGVTRRCDQEAPVSSGGGVHTGHHDVLRDGGRTQGLQHCGTAQRVGKVDFIADARRL